MGTSQSKERVKLIHNNPEVFYQKQEYIGKGSFGTVYKVKEIKTKYVYAAKIITYNEFSDNPSISEELIINSMIRCPFITKFYSAFDFEEQKEIWILFEYCNYGTVSDLLRSYTLPEPIIARIIRDVLLALTYLHYSNEIIIHRDIKASNILLKSKGRVKLSDFGVSTRLARQDTIVNNFAGTLNSIAPEIYKGDGISTKSDIWSVGILCIELCEGQPPFNGLTKEQITSIMKKNPVLGLNHPENFCKELQDFIYLCLQPSPTFRPSARRLLMHPFLVTAASDNYLSSYLAKHPVYKYNRSTILPSSLCSSNLPSFSESENQLTKKNRRSLSMPASVLSTYISKGSPYTDSSPSNSMHMNSQLNGNTHSLCPSPYHHTAYSAETSIFKTTTVSAKNSVSHINTPYSSTPLSMNSMTMKQHKFSLSPPGSVRNNMHSPLYYPNSSVSTNTGHSSGNSISQTPIKLPYYEGSSDIENEGHSLNLNNVHTSTLQHTMSSCSSIDKQETVFDSVLYTNAQVNKNITTNTLSLVSASLSPIMSSSSYLNIPAGSTPVDSYPEDSSLFSSHKNSYEYNDRIQKDSFNTTTISSFSLSNSNTTPSNTTPSNTTPSNTTPSNATPSNATPSNTTPSNMNMNNMNVNNTNINNMNNSIADMNAIYKPYVQSPHSFSVISSQYGVSPLLTPQNRRKSDISHRCNPGKSDSDAHYSLNNSDEELILSHPVIQMYKLNDIHNNENQLKETRTNSVPIPDVFSHNMSESVDSYERSFSGSHISPIRIQSNMSQLSQESLSSLSTYSNPSYISTVNSTDKSKDILFQSIIKPDIYKSMYYPCPPLSSMSIYIDPETRTIEVNNSKDKDKSKEKEREMSSFSASSSYEETRDNSLSPSLSDDDEHPDAVEEVDSQEFGCFSGNRSRQHYLNSLNVQDIYEKNNHFAISYHTIPTQTTSSDYENIRYMNIYTDRYVFFLKSICNEYSIDYINYNFYTFYLFQNYIDMFLRPVCGSENEENISNGTYKPIEVINSKEECLHFKEINQLFMSFQQSYHLYSKGFYDSAYSLVISEYNDNNTELCMYDDDWWKEQWDIYKFWIYNESDICFKYLGTSVGNLLTGHSLVILGHVPTSFTNSIKLIEGAIYFNVFKEISQENVDTFNKEKEFFQKCKRYYK